MGQVKLYHVLEGMNLQIATKLWSIGRQGFEP